MRGRVECPSCGYVWTTTALGATDDGRHNTHKRRGCHHCGAWRNWRILEVLPDPPPAPEPSVCAAAGCATRLHSRAEKEGRILCYVHERAELDAEVAAGVAAFEAREARRVERAAREAAEEKAAREVTPARVAAALRLVRRMVDAGTWSPDAYGRHRGRLPEGPVLRRRCGGTWAHVVDAATGERREAA